jgi:hypothetical protein
MFAEIGINSKVGNRTYTSFSFTVTKFLIIMRLLQCNRHSYQWNEWIHISILYFQMTPTPLKRNISGSSTKIKCQLLWWRNYSEELSILKSQNIEFTINGHQMQDFSIRHTKIWQDKITIKAVLVWNQKKKSDIKAFVSFA